VTVEREGYLTDLLSDRAESHVREQASAKRPFFLSLHYTAPHWPWSAPSDEQGSRAREMKIAARHLSHDGGSPRIYAEMVTTMDRGIGRVLDALRDAGVERDTLVIFTSDNGGERYSNMWPFVGRKRDLLEGGLRVPLLVRWPQRIAAGRVSSQVAISMDLTATCLAAAGVQMPAATPLDGVDLLPQMADGAPEVERTLYWRMQDPCQRALRDGRWKYLHIDGKDHLFDLEVDCRERTDFAQQHPDRLADLHARWHAWSETMLPMPDQRPEGRLIDLASMRW
jgi:arylsulfatase A-like enzyme